MSSGGTRLQTRVSLEDKVYQRVLTLETHKFRHWTSILKQQNLDRIDATQGLLVSNLIIFQGLEIILATKPYWIL